MNDDNWRRLHFHVVMSIQLLWFCWIDNLTVMISERSNTISSNAPLMEYFNSIFKSQFLLFYNCHPERIAFCFMSRNDRGSPEDMMPYASLNHLRCYIYRKYVYDQDTDEPSKLSACLHSMYTRNL